MFTGSRFFTLAKKYVNNDDAHRLGILRILMNHYFDSFYPNHSKSNVVTVPMKHIYSKFDVEVVLSDVGYNNYSISEIKNFYVITLRSAL